MSVDWSKKKRSYNEYRCYLCNKITGVIYYVDIDFPGKKFCSRKCIEVCKLTGGMSNE